jgi:hypothetical protein
MMKKLSQKSKKVLFLSNRKYDICESWNRKELPSLEEADPFEYVCVDDGHLYLNIVE